MKKEEKLAVLMEYPAGRVPELRKLMKTSVHRCLPDKISGRVSG
jgi:hypothetical protein